MRILGLASVVGVGVRGVSVLHAAASAVAISSSSETEDDTAAAAAAAVAFNATALDCEMRKLSMAYSQRLHPWRLQRSDTTTEDVVLRQIFDALELRQRCHIEDLQQLHGTTTTTTTKTTTTTTTTRLKNNDTTTTSIEATVAAAFPNTTTTPLTARTQLKTPKTTTRRTAGTEVCHTRYCIFVVPQNTATAGVVSGGSQTQQQHPDGTKENPMPLLEMALARSREIGHAFETTIVLLGGGVHYHRLSAPLHLTHVDSGLTIVGSSDNDDDDDDDDDDDPNNNIVWISGSIPIPDDVHWDWDCNLNLNVRVANLSQVLLGNKRQASLLPRIPSLFGPDKRMIRARFPNNGDPETLQWGYNTPDRFNSCIPAWEVEEWLKPCEKGPLPTFDYVDFTTHNNTVTPYTKNDSAMPNYNVYASGRGGVCADLWNDSSSYWCSNASAGGWSEVDLECATTGRLQIPVGLRYNASSDIGQRLREIGDAAVGGIVHAWHSQTWAMHMFQIQSISSSSSNGTTFHFTKDSGKQGGRNWCRCDQCTYAGKWCGQHEDPPRNDDDRLVGGDWIIENVLGELDAPGEFFFDPHTKLLYLYPNATTTTTMTEMETDPTRRSAGLRGLSLAMLDTYIVMDEGASNITIRNIGFRDSAATYFSDWHVPSGGDWALHPGGVIQISNASNIVIQNCSFHRLDGNAIFLTGRTRNVQIQQNVFEWLGENAIVLLGQSDGFDATADNRPMRTFIKGNVMRELGIFQKQSSAIAVNKASQTFIRRNIIFNVPRAAINFNDMTGGGDIVERNLLFNTCRESGDHGPINTWDRQPFLTKQRTGQEPSFIPEYRTIRHNFIIANYGAGWAVDNDDGSSWYHIHSNVMYDSQGFKMDYGGHDSVYQHNIVISFPDKQHQSQECVGFDRFLEGHGHVVKHNLCIVPRSDSPIVRVVDCEGPQKPDIHNNHYMTPDGTAGVMCESTFGQGQVVRFETIQKQVGFEQNSTVHKLPLRFTTIVGWCKRLLFDPNARIILDPNNNKDILVASTS